MKHLFLAGIAIVGIATSQAHAGNQKPEAAADAERITIYYGPRLLPPLPALVAGSPWRGPQGRVRNTEDLRPGPGHFPPVRMAASNTIGPRGGGEVYIYLY